MSAPSQNTVRIALAVIGHMNQGASLSHAVHTAAAMLGVAPAAVASCLTVTQDWVADTGVTVESLAA